MKNKNTNIAPKQKIIHAAIFLLIFIALSVFLWLFTNRWLYGLIPIAFIYVFQWVYDAYTFGYFYPPLSQPIVKYVKRKIRVKYYRKQRKANGLPEISTAADHIHAKPQITISDWLVTDMAHATYDNDYSSCYDRETYELLMNDYAEAKGGEGMEDYKLNMKDKLLLQADMLAIVFNMEILKDRWSESAAEALRRFGKPFTKETLEADLKYMEAYLIGERRKLSELNIELEKLNNVESTPITTYKQYVQHIEDLLVSMADVQQGANYSIEGMKVSKLAAIERARARYIKQQNEQILKLKTGK